MTTADDMVIAGWPERITPEVHLELPILLEHAITICLHVISAKPIQEHVKVYTMDAEKRVGCAFDKSCPKSSGNLFTAL